MDKGRRTSLRERAQREKERILLVAIIIYDLSSQQLRGSTVHRNTIHVCMQKFSVYCIGLANEWHPCNFSSEYYEQSTPNGHVHVPIHTLVYVQVHVCLYNNIHMHTHTSREGFVPYNCVKRVSGTITPSHMQRTTE